MNPTPPPPSPPVPPPTGFGPTLLDAPGVWPDPGRVAPVHDLCQSGVVLRALLFVHGVIALAACFSATDMASWWPLFAIGSALALPALLLWLSTACLVQRAAPAAPGVVLAGLGVAGGAACALLPWWAWQSLQAAAVSPMRSAAVAATGAALSGAFTLWLGQRARLRQPATTTARLAELQSRIRPHFLFNTLNTAITLVRVDPARAESVLEDLAELFRVALADAGADASATLEEEVELAKRYLAIEQLRFGDRLKVRWELDPAAAGARLPPLLLQPLLENAVRHGVEPSALGGQIRVRTRVRRGQVEIAVANDVPTEASMPGHGMALRNVRERLRLMHDVAADFRASLEGGVYRVDIVVPL